MNTFVLNKHRLEDIKFVGKPVFTSALPYDVQEKIFESEDMVRLLFQIERKTCDDLNRRLRRAYTRSCKEEK